MTIPPTRLLTLDGQPTWLYDSCLIEQIEDAYTAAQLCGEELFAKIRKGDQLWTFTNGAAAFRALSGRAGVVLLRGVDNDTGGVDKRVVGISVTIMS